VVVVKKKNNPNFLGKNSPNWSKGYDPKCSCKRCTEVREGRWYLHECEHYDFDRDLCRLGYVYDECSEKCKDFSMESEKR